MPRPDRIGSKITYKTSEEGNEYTGKVISRKKGSGVVICCLDGPNRGNTKIISPNHIIVPSDEGKKKKKKNESVQSLIESDLSPEQIRTQLLEAQPFRMEYFVSQAQLRQILKKMGEDADFITEDDGRFILGWYRGERELTFRYDKETSTMYADYTLPGMP